MSELNVVRVKLVLDMPLYSEQSINTPSDAVAIMQKELSTWDREVLCVLNLNTKNKPINMSIVSIGDISGSIATMREVFKSSLLSNAAHMIALHNHPSGDPTPSKEDIIVTKKMQIAGDLMGVEILDHIIIGGGSGSRYSFREEGVMELKKGMFDRFIKDAIPEKIVERGR